VFPGKVSSARAFLSGERLGSNDSVGGSSQKASGNVRKT
jgi:hypothetical protein